MGKGKRLRQAREAQRAWSLTQESRNAVRWRADALQLVSDETAHRQREYRDHMDRMRHALQLMTAHATDPSATFEQAWMSFWRPLVRLAFASGMDVSGVTWHDPMVAAKENPERINRFVLDAIEADRQCDLAALNGGLFVVSPEVHLVIAACAASMSIREVLEAFVDADLPAPTGMILLPDRKPWVSLPHTRALTWQRLPRVTWGQQATYAVPSMRMKGYVHSSIFHHIMAPGQRFAVQKDTLLYSGQRDIEPCLGELEEHDADDFENMLYQAVEMRLAHDDFIAKSDEIGHQVGEEIGEARLDHDPAKPMTLASYMAAFTRVVDQEILTTEPAERESSVEGSTRGDLPENDIQILRLRRMVDGGEDAVKSVNWSHRWVVQMHKVRQWYPSLGRHKTIWRGPYIKGPDGAPLRLPKERVHGVVR